MALRGYCAAFGQTAALQTALGCSAATYTCDSVPQASCQGEGGSDLALRYQTETPWVIIGAVSAGIVLLVGIACIVRLRTRK